MSDYGHRYTEMKGITLVLILLSFVCAHSQPQLMRDAVLYDDNFSCRVLDVREYSFDNLVNEGIETYARQLKVLNIPVRQFRHIIKWYVNRNHFAIGKEQRCKTAFRAISFIYPSVTPQGDSVMLSGLVTLPIVKNSSPRRMLVYHRILAAYNSIAPSNSLPLESVITADNTICVFPDYYGCGVTEEFPLSFIALNYHARCATECVLAALDIVEGNGVTFSPGFYTWITGYSQAAGYALATHRYIEESLPDSLRQRINIRWSLCGDGVYMPARLYEAAVLADDLGNTPSIYLQSLRGLFNSYPERLHGLAISDFMSNKAVESGIDSILYTYDNGLWDLADRLAWRDKSHRPAYYFSPSVVDTSTLQYKTLLSVLSLDDCVSGWHPQACVALVHSRKDRTIPFHLAEQVQGRLSDANGCCFLRTPKLNGSHLLSGFFYLSNLLRFNENELYERFIESNNKE